MPFKAFMNQALSPCFESCFEEQGHAATNMGAVICVVVATPSHSELGACLSYLHTGPLVPGTLVRVPLGKREVLGIVWDGQGPEQVPPEAAALRPISQVLEGVAPLDLHWRRLVAFAAGYYQRSMGEVALAALPPALRELDAQQLQRRLRTVAKLSGTVQDGTVVDANLGASWPELAPEQASVLEHIRDGRGPFLLFGVTGSGKTEVYMRAVREVLERDPAAQALVMVPEINLTPQLEQRFVQRFGAAAVVSLHSGMTPAVRLRHWLAAHQGLARVVLGTRLSVFASMPGLRLIVVDEEHDPSYKSQDGARFSARDLAVYRASMAPANGSVPSQVILGSATPSLESWHLSRPAQDGGRYQRLCMPSRVGTAALPQVRLVDMRAQPKQTVLSAALVQAIAERVQRQEQSLLLLNRRGYAPVLQCPSCDWKSTCPHCSAYRVFHKIDRTLRCHHCGLTQRVPRACPQCGDLDITSVGRGTERLEEHLGELLAGMRRPDGSGVRIARIDADSTRHKGSLEVQLAQVHANEVDVLVGTQMLAKGHDFRHVTLVAAVNPDGALYSADYRASERMFSLLMQAGGRAGRDAAYSARSEMWVQTSQPQHPLYAALVGHDYPRFAAGALRERQQAGMPPFGYQALLRADARTQQAAQGFLQALSDQADALPDRAAMQVYSPIPMAMQRLADVERAQMLVECSSRQVLQRFLAQCQPLLHLLRKSTAGRGVMRWAIDVDPTSV